MKHYYSLVLSQPDAFAGYQSTIAHMLPHGWEPAPDRPTTCPILYIYVHLVDGVRMADVPEIRDRDTLISLVWEPHKCKYPRDHLALEIPHNTTERVLYLTMLREGISYHTKLNGHSPIPDPQVVSFFPGQLLPPRYEAAVQAYTLGTITRRDQHYLFLEQEGDDRVYGCVVYDRIPVSVGSVAVIQYTSTTTKDGTQALIQALDTEAIILMPYPNLTVTYTFTRIGFTRLSPYVTLRGCSVGYLNVCGQMFIDGTTPLTDDDLSSLGLDIQTGATT